MTLLSREAFKDTIADKVIQPPQISYWGYRRKKGTIRDHLVKEAFHCFQSKGLCLLLTSLRAEWKEEGGRLLYSELQTHTWLFHLCARERVQILLSANHFNQLNATSSHLQRAPQMEVWDGAFRKPCGPAKGGKTGAWGSGEDKGCRT